MSLMREGNSWLDAVEASTALLVHSSLLRASLETKSGLVGLTIKILGASLSTMLMNWQEDRVVLIKYWHSKWVTMILLNENDYKS